MPFYEYECSSCKFYTEVMQKITDTPLTKCPSCGKKALKKLVSAPNFRLKGGGWYETDFKGDQENRRNLAGADKDETPAKADSDAGKPKAEGDEAAKADKTEKSDKPDKSEARASEKPEKKPAPAAAKNRSSRPAKTAARAPARGTPARAVSKGKAAKSKKSASRKKSRR